MCVCLYLEEEEEICKGLEDGMKIMVLRNYG